MMTEHTEIIAHNYHYSLLSTNWLLLLHCEIGNKRLVNFHARNPRNFVYSSIYIFNFYSRNPF